MRQPVESLGKPQEGMCRLGKSSFHQDEAEAPHTRGKVPVMSPTLRITCQSPCHVIDLKNYTRGVSMGAQDFGHV